MTGPIKDDKLTPRITQSAKAIWLIYLSIIFICALAYKLGGMNWFDAVGHAFSTISTGGFSTHDAGFAYFSNPFLKVIAIFFMFLGAVSFNLHFFVLKRKSLSFYWKDPELRFFLYLIIGLVISAWLSIVLIGKHLSSFSIFLETVFQVVSFITTSGFTSTMPPFPTFILMMLLFASLIGGCAGSTTGGVKAVRVLLLQKQGAREIKRLIHPRGQYVIKLGTQPMGPHVIEAIWGFFAIYFVTFTFLLLLLVGVEEDFFTLYTSLISALSNAGPGLGKVATNFSTLSDYAKWILSLAMLIGRLEIFTLLVLLSPTFWRR